MSNVVLTVSAVQDAVQSFPDAETGRSAMQLGQIRDVMVTGNDIRLTFAQTTHSAPLWTEKREELQQLLKVRFPQASITINHAVQERPAQPLGQIGVTAKSVIAVGSGKGGVGKSTMAVSLALGLKRAGCRVGLMDADVYGPSVPHLLGLTGQPGIVDKKMSPIMHDGMPVMSMGFLVPPGEAVVWRGPMLHGAITQFLRDTNWGDLDYLIIDMPPGTGDIALTLSQMLPLTGAVVVCTPQEVALLDAVKAIAMFRKVNISVLGMIENMSGFVCPDCDKRYDIFGSGGARKRAEELEVPFLGDVPIHISIRQHGDDGVTAANYDDVRVAPYLQKIVYQLTKNLATQAAANPVIPQLPVL